MKKKLKIVLLLLITLVLTTSGAILYFFKFKEYDVADEEVTQIIEDPYAIEMPDGTTITLDGDKEATGSKQTDFVQTALASEAKSPVTEGNGTSSKETSTSGDKGATPTKENSKSTEKTQKTTASSVKEKYVPALESLQAQADNKLNSLIGRAKKEYYDKKEKGERVSFPYFYNKYMNVANGLEAQTDAAFGNVIKAVEKDLVENGFDKSEAQSLVDDYNTTKKARKDSLLSKAMNQ